MTSTALTALLTAERRSTAILLGAGGLLVAIGGQFHPVAEGDSLSAALASMTRDDLWVVSHLLLLAGPTVAALGLAQARRKCVFGPSVDPWLRLAIVGFTVGALELVPHVLASHDQAELDAGRITSLVRLHLVLQAVSGPLLALGLASLAVAVARAAHTKPAWVLAF